MFNIKSNNKQVNLLTDSDIDKSGGGVVSYTRFSKISDHFSSGSSNFKIVSLSTRAEANGGTAKPNICLDLSSIHKAGAWGWAFIIGSKEDGSPLMESVNLILNTPGSNLQVKASGNNSTAWKNIATYDKAALNVGSYADFVIIHHPNLSVYVDK